MSLKTDYKDFELAPSMGGKRRYKMINNDDGTVSFVDVSEYLEIGDTFDGADINATNSAVNVADSRLNYFINSDNKTNAYTGNLNDIDINSIYNASETVQNTPIAEWGFVQTFIHGFNTAYRTQIFTTMYAMPPKMYIRECVDNNWTNWVEISNGRSGINEAQLMANAIGLNMSFEELTRSVTVAFFTNWHDSTNFPALYGSGIFLPCLDAENGIILYIVTTTGETWTRNKTATGWQDWKKL